MGGTVKTQHLYTVPADYSDCLSLGAKYFEIVAFNNISKPLAGKQNKVLHQTATNPINHKYFLIVFELTFKKYVLGANYLAPYLAVLNITLENNYLASDGAPKIEKNLTNLNLKYSYGSKIENSSKLSFKLGWENKDQPTQANFNTQISDKLSNEYSVIVETVANIKNCTAQFQNPLSVNPKWEFDRASNERVLIDNREVWLVVETKIANDKPCIAKADLSARFTIVEEEERTLDKLTSAQVRIFKKVKFSSLRTWFKKPKFKKKLSIQIENQ